MPNHKRKRAKAQRAGCTCKWWKFEGNTWNAVPASTRRRVLLDDGTKGKSNLNLYAGTVI